MSRSASTPDRYVFTFADDGVVTSVAEVERDGRLDHERIEKDESYRLTDGLVVRTELDGREQEWTVYGDADGDGYWTEIAEGEGALDPGVLARLRGEPAETTPPLTTAAGADQYVFVFDDLGRIVSVSEVERDGRLEREEIEPGESYALSNGLVIKTELDDGRFEQTVYADPEGDGLWSEVAQLQPGAGWSYSELW
ncbi:MAG: hypothetical protein EPO51_27390 [Phenylobacterium sp.]|uniref:hypothetical protein n=1 Tax=Phenylobacterium sp. TaxID=1871053 RepID=UPI00121D2D55|nr:hypothetical protein [Phenylobacterium sp.]TAJ68605.1 MAG: hypothetical protein EPO51_27390 [Phenylobacterium sp.]